MSRIFRWLRTFTRVQYPYSDPYDQQRARGLIRMAWGIVIIALAFLITYVPTGGLTGPGAQISVALTFMAMIGMIGVILLINRGNLVPASLVYILVLYMAVTVSYIYNPTPMYVIMFTIPVVATGVLLNRRGMVVMIGLVLLALAMTTAFVSANMLQVAPPTFTVFSVLSVGIILAVDAVMLVVFAGGQRALQRRTQELTQELRSSAEITQAIAGIQTVDELLQRTVELIREGLNYYHVRIFLLEEKTQLLVLQAGTTTSNQVGAVQRRIAPDDPSLIYQVVKSGQAMRISIDDTAPRQGELLSNMQAQLLVPLKRENRSLGVLDVQSNQPGAFEPEDVEILEAVATQVAIAIENARLYSQLNTSSQERQKLAEQLLEVRREMEQLNQEVIGRAWARYLAGRGENVIGYDWKDGSAASHTYITGGLDRALNSALPELYTEGTEQILSVPIISRGQTLGAMEFRAPAERGWNDRSIELARVISQRLALALDNLRLFEQAQIIANREQTANQISSTLQAKTDLDSLVSVAAETFQQALGATRTSVRLGRPEGQKDGQTDRQTEGQTNRGAESQTGGPALRQPDIQVDKATDKQTDRQAGQNGNHQ